MFTYCATTAEFLAAIGPDKMIGLGPGTFGPITAQVDLSNSSNLTIFGCGYATNIVFNVSGNGIGGSGCSRVTIANLRISGTSGRAVAFTNGSDIAVRGCWISGATVANGPSSGIFFQDVNDSVIEENHLNGNGLGPSAGDTSLDILVNGSSSRNQIVGNIATSTSVQMNIGVQTSASGQTCDDNKIVNNHASGAIANLADPANNVAANTKWGYGIMVYYYGTPPRRTVVSGNTIRNTQGIGIYVNGLSTVVANNTLDNNCTTVAGHGAASITVYSTAPHCTITGNTIRNFKQAAIRALAGFTTITSNTITSNASASETAHGIHISTHDDVANPEGIIVANNIITDVTGGGNQGIFADRCKSPTVSNNSIGSCQSHGIRMSSCSRGSIVNNSIANGGGSVPGSYSGILIDGGTDVIASLNTVYGASFGYGISNSCTRAHITNNNLYGSGSSAIAGINDTGTNTFRRGNQFSSDPLSGIATLSNGTVTINSTEIKTGDIVRATHVQLGGATVGVMLVRGTIVNGTSFVINSVGTSGQIVTSDSSIIEWEIVH